jgi:hypothetical protein
MKKSIQFSCAVLILLLFILSISSISSNAASIKNLITQEGLMVGYGNGYFGDSHHKKYKTFLNIIHVSFDAHKILPSIMPQINKKLSIYLEPQYNIVTNYSDNYEVGVGFGLEYRFKLVKNLDGYVMAGSGIHYISYHSKYQSAGLNFNDNLGYGVYIFTTKKSAINIGLRFRHISNAGLNKPNKGINSFITTLGYSIFFQ